MKVFAILSLLSSLAFAHPQAPADNSGYQDLTVSFHAEYYGTSAVPRAVTLHNLQCTDRFVGPGDGIINSEIMYQYTEGLGYHMLASASPSFTCGDCLEFKNKADGTRDWGMVIDQGGGVLDLHPDLFVKVVPDRGTGAQPYPYFDAQAGQRFLGIGTGTVLVRKLQPGDELYNQCIFYKK
ncbi:hypothetical protein ROZALSC1DRAFT_28761 [Rozella allomycis CSF55]|uniref:Uncharacterized protein n=1 Tax=Rozella allomycis (strain CSF55) TaxID=988480 RepID=A0A075ARX9_ROZAC|nr:hypothetical protein O9G_002940 [Rozella allomycis CSF55]RKP19660.1 hypothetical protein ROZALSC1DRAFT_28761 [Rozella allomycis CSF55]|eukprot:EPZ31471.1 hypothetical protein O9G_002940 [Rozella allomycis CSF55]